MPELVTSALFSGLLLALPLALFCPLPSPAKHHQTPPNNVCRRNRQPSHPVCRSRCRQRPEDRTEGVRHLRRQGRGRCQEGQRGDQEGGRRRQRRSQEDVCQGQQRVGEVLQPIEEARQLLQEGLQLGLLPGEASRHLYTTTTNTDNATAT